MKSCSNSSSSLTGHQLPSPSGVDRPLTIGDCFLTWKPELVIYGDYCSNLPLAQQLIDELCNKDDSINLAVDRCQIEANEGKFKLRDLLSVPMQRVLKYHLLLKELVKNTNKTHDDYEGLERALDAMLDLAHYINEVKRDNETLQIIRDIQASITDLCMPENMELKDYGRLLKDGELKIRSHNDSNKLKNRYVFMFDRVMLMCKSTRGEQYSYKEALILCDYKVEDSPSATTRSSGISKWSHYWYLVHRQNRTAYTMYAKTEEIKQKWIEAIERALDNACPQECCSTDHKFGMHTFHPPKTCDNCGKLLRGVFYQGYRCAVCGISVHKACIATVRVCGAPSLPPRPPFLDRPESVCEPPSCHTFPINKAVALRPYQSDVPGHLSFQVNDVIYVTRKLSPALWEGRVNRTNKEGLFPADHVDESPRLEEPSGIAELPSPGLSPGEPYHNLVPEEYLWYAGKMDHETATNRLDKLPNGTFLVRISERQNGKYAISIKHENRVKHMRVCLSEDSRYYLSDSKYFKSLVELVRWYEENTLAESFNGLNIKLLNPYKKVLNGFGSSYPTQNSSTVPISEAVVNFDYSSNEQNMLSIKKGERVVILSKRGGDRGWWKGKIGDQVGYFPKAYVTEVTN